MKADFHNQGQRRQLTVSSSREFARVCSAIESSKVHLCVKPGVMPGCEDRISLVTTVHHARPNCIVNTRYSLSARAQYT